MYFPKQNITCEGTVHKISKISLINEINGIRNSWIEQEYTYENL